MLTVNDVFRLLELSMDRKISQLKRSSVACLLSLKVNVDQECFNYIPPPDLLKINNAAVLEIQPGAL